MLMIAGMYAVGEVANLLQKNDKAKAEHIYNQYVLQVLGVNANGIDQELSRHGETI